MKPWRVLIADDEPKIRSGLSGQIARMNLNAEVCAVAEDGEMALELAERERPDILLVDINMPFMNGLQFIEALRRTRSDVKIIVITGYEKFEYARTAVDLDVYAYLLKPIDLQELKRVIQAAIHQLEQERAHRRHFEWAIAQINSRRDFLQEVFLRDAISGRLDVEEIRDFGVYFSIPSGNRLKLMLIVVRSSNSGAKPWAPLLRRYTLQDALEADKSGGEGFRCLFLDDRDNIVLLYEQGAFGDEDLAARTREALEGELGISARTEVSGELELTAIAEAYDAMLERVEAQGDYSPIVDAAKEYIAKHYSDPELEVNGVADRLSIHPVYLSRLMKQELGMPFARYLTHVRIGRAIELMADPNAKIWQIAEKVGYHGANNFSAAFKRVLGVSPAEYRMEGKQE